MHHTLFISVQCIVSIIKTHRLTIVVVSKDDKSGWSRLCSAEHSSLFMLFGVCGDRGEYSRFLHLTCKPIQERLIHFVLGLHLFIDSWATLYHLFNNMCKFSRSIFVADELWRYWCAVQTVRIPKSVICPCVCNKF